MRAIYDNLYILFIMYVSFYKHPQLERFLFTHPHKKSCIAIHDFQKNFFLEVKVSSLNIRAEFFFVSKSCIGIHVFFRADV